MADVRPALFSGIVLALLALLAGAGYLHVGAHGGAAPAARVVRIRLPSGTPLELAAITFEPVRHVRAARLDTQGELSVALAGPYLTVSIPGLCPLTISSTTPEVVPPPKALFDVGPDRTQIGYDAPFAIEVVRGCAEAERGRVEWTQLEGPPLAALAIGARGFRIAARTLPRANFLPDPLPAGIVPVSPRTQGRYVLEAQASLDGRTVLRRAVVVTSMARATGLSSLAVSQRVMLGGTGFVVAHAPRGARAQVTLHDGVQTFAPDRPGRYLLTDATGGWLELQALTHDRTPMDCGRAECHASLSTAALGSPMSHALELPLGGTDPATLGCTLDCHAVGERGLDDGGFLDVATELGFRLDLAESEAELPHALRRLGGVRCTSCHGPGAIPATAGRARILRADVCATCHDAPPVYDHVSSWRRSRMARSDAAASVRAAPACARCHTTGGFLNALGVRPRVDASRDPDDAVVGIACAACHAPHGDHLPRALLRAVEPPASLHGESRLEASPSALCARCHAPDLDARSPAASGAALWLGRVRLPASLGGATQLGPAPHADVRGGCIGCHGGSAGEGHAALDHDFAVAPATCAPCHEEAPPSRDPALAVRARTLVAAIQGSALEPASATSGPPHAQLDAASRGAPSGLRARALYLALLVAEDPAADVHNAPFARALLDEATSLLARAASTALGPVAHP